MKILKWGIGLLLFAALVVVVQLADPLKDSATAKFQRLPDAGLTGIAEGRLASGQSDTAWLLLDYVIENDLPDRPQATALRKKLSAQAEADTSPAGRLRATGLTTSSGSGANSFGSLAGNSVADSVLYGDIADLAKQGALDSGADPLVSSLNKITGISVVFPPADGAIALVKAAKLGGAINESLTKQLSQMLTLMQADPKSSLSVEKFKENFMPVFELAKRSRSWAEFETILQQADSADQVKVLIKMVSATPAAAKRLSQVLTLANAEGPATAAVCLDHVLRQGPGGIESLYAAIGKGVPGLKFVAEHPGLTPQSLAATAKRGWAQQQYQSLRDQYGAGASAVKYLLIAVLCGLLVLVVVPGKYLEKLVARPGTAIVPGPAHYLVSALVVGLVISVLAYLLSLAVRPSVDFAGVVSATGEAGAAKGDSAVLSGTVVLLSLTIHAIVWFFVRSKIRSVEDDDAAEAALRLRRLENLDVFLDLPLFTGLALTVVAFILITLDAGMSRHFAYTSTVVGILSSVSLRIRYVYPLKERLIQGR